MAIFNSYVSLPEGILYSRLLDCEHPEADLEIRDAGRDDDRLTERWRAARHAARGHVPMERRRWEAPLLGSCPGIPDLIQWHGFNWVQFDQGPIVTDPENVQFLLETFFPTPIWPGPCDFTEG